MRISNSVDPHITFSPTFLEWEAAIAAGATLDELNKLTNGEYPTLFRAKLVVWYQYHNLVKAHQEDASAQAAKRK